MADDILTVDGKRAAPLISPERQEAAQRALFRRRVGQELRELREASGLSQESVADLFNWSRDAISKIERGDRPLGMYEWLRLMQFYRDAIPNHPGVALVARLLPSVPRLPIQGRAEDKPGKR